MSAKSQHDYAVFLFQQGRYADAIMQFDELLQEKQTGEMWSDRRLRSSRYAITKKRNVDFAERSS